MSEEFFVCDICGMLYCPSCVPDALSECVVGDMLHCDSCLAKCEPCQSAAFEEPPPPPHQDYPPLTIIDGGSHSSPDSRHSW